MASIYFYKLMADAGAAPCVRDRLLSLAICKPMIRATAEPGDWIFGFAANSLHRDNRLIYIARVTDKVTDGHYYRDPRFAHRGDCIYQWRGGRFTWRPGALYHGPRDLIHDLGSPPDYARAQVLLSRDFRYFGRDGSAAWKTKYSSIRRAVEELGRGHRVRHDARVQEELLALQRATWRATRASDIAPPTTGPRRSTCHRARSCGVLQLSSQASG